MSDLVGDLNCWFSHAAAQFSSNISVPRSISAPAIQKTVLTPGTPERNGTTPVSSPQTPVSAVTVEPVNKAVPVSTHTQAVPATTPTQAAPATTPTQVSKFVMYDHVYGLIPFLAHLSRQAHKVSL